MINRRSMQTKSPTKVPMGCWRRNLWPSNCRLRSKNHRRLSASVILARRSRTKASGIRKNITETCGGRKRILPCICSRPSESYAARTRGHPHPNLSRQGRERSSSECPQTLGPEKTSRWVRLSAHGSRRPPHVRPAANTDDPPRSIRKP